jgi:hypothetical protein
LPLLASVVAARLYCLDPHLRLPQQLPHLLPFKESENERERASPPAHARAFLFWKAKIGAGKKKKKKNQRGFCFPTPIRAPTGQACQKKGGGWGLGSLFF